MWGWPCIMIINHILRCGFGKLKSPEPENFSCLDRRQSFKNKFTVYGCRIPLTKDNSHATAHSLMW